MMNRPDVGAGDRDEQWRLLRADGWVDLSDVNLDAREIHAQTVLLGWPPVYDLLGIDRWSRESKWRLLQKLTLLRENHQEAIVRGLNHGR